MTYIEQIHIFLHGLVNVFYQIHESQPMETAVYQQINIAGAVSVAFAVGAEQNRPFYAMPTKNRCQSFFDFACRLDPIACFHGTYLFIIGSD